MGNCSPKPKHRRRSAKTPVEPSSLPAVRLRGSETCPIAWRIRVALLYKGVAVEFVESGADAGKPCLCCGSEIMSGSEESLLRYIDKRFGGPQAASTASSENRGMGTVAEVVALQHRSMQRHLEGITCWVGKMAGEGGGGGGGVGRAKGADRRRMWRRYAELVEIMLEHAQMEERSLFPAFDRVVDYDVCRRANEEHGRDLPIMNGIKEDIKSIMAMDVEGTLYKEALNILSLRLKILQEHCKQHFEEEERELLPLLQVAERVRREDGEVPWLPNKWIEGVVAPMETAHSRLFAFFMASLLPHEALRYVTLVTGADQHKAIAMLQSLTTAMETSPLIF